MRTATGFPVAVVLYALTDYSLQRMQGWPQSKTLTAVINHNGPSLSGIGILRLNNDAVAA